MTASGRSLPVIVTKRAGQIRCNRWSDRTQMTGQVECKRVGKWGAIPGHQTEVNLAANRTECGVSAFERTAMDFLIDTVEKMADNDPASGRTLFVLATLFAMCLRVSYLIARNS